MKFNEKLKSLREGKGYTQDEIASKLNIARQSVSKWEQGINEPDFDTTKKLCQILDCSLDDLIDDDRDVSTSKEQKRNIVALRLYKISLFVLGVGALMVFALLAAADDVIVSNWGLNGAVTLGSKWNLLFDLLPIVIFGGVSTFMYFLSKKNQYYRKHIIASEVVAVIISIIVVALAMVMGSLMIKDHHKNTNALFNLLPAAILAILVAVGPFTHPKFNKRNAFFGFRTNFTMSNEEAWNKVNALASIVLTAVGFIAFVLVLIFIEKDWAMLFIPTIVLAIIPCFIYHEVLRNKLRK